MPQESANKGDWLSNPKFARRVLWVTVGTVGWLILMVFVLEMNLGPDRDSAGLGLVVVGPFAVAFVAMGLGFTLAIPDRFPVARSIVSLVFLVIALLYTGMFTWVVLCCS